MPRFTVTPSVTGFSCAAGSVTAEEDGSFVIENGTIMQAMREHGLTLTEIPEPEAPPVGNTEPPPAKTPKAGGKKDAVAPTAKEAEQTTGQAGDLDAAMKAALAAGDTGA